MKDRERSEWGSIRVVLWSPASEGESQHMNSDSYDAKSMQGAAEKDVWLKLDVWFKIFWKLIIQMKLLYSEK